jgi:hypothetical protein
MSQEKSAQELQAKIDSYEELLRRLIAEADDEQKLFAFRQSGKSECGPTLFESGQHHVYQLVRQYASYTLKQFHPEIAGVKPSAKGPPSVQ